MLQYIKLFPRASERRVLLISGVCQTSSHLHIFSSLHPHILTSSHLDIFSSSHFTSSHVHIFTSASHLHVLITSSHLHILTSSHLLIFTSSHLLIFTFSHLLIFTSHLLIFTLHLHIFSSSHSLLPSCSLSLLLSCPLALSFFSISLLKARGSANETARNATVSYEMRFGRRFPGSRRNPFARNEVRSPKTDVKLRFAKRPAQPFRTKWFSISKNWGKVAICKSDGEPFSHEMRFDRQKLR